MTRFCGSSGPALDRAYGDRLERAILYGSRGDARNDSDYDIAVFLKDLNDRWAELDRLADMETKILSETGDGVSGGLLAGSHPVGNPS